MKLTVILLTVAFLQVNANGFSQTITYSGKNVPLEKVFSVIKEQAGFSFIYFDEQLKDARKVTINVKNVEVEEVLAICMKDQPYDYTIKAKTIFIINRQKKEPAAGKSFTSKQGDKRINISGKVTGEQGEPVIGATITIKGSDVITTTNDKGEFFLNDVEEDAVLVVTNVSYQGQEIALRGRSSIDVRMKVDVSDLDEAVVVAYNTTTQRRNTSAVTVVKGEQVQNLPYRSFDKSLQGLVPGLLVTKGTGQPGSGVSNFVLRGIATGGSPLDGSTVRNPLIVVDGVPVFQDPAQAVTTSITFNNPMAQLNPSDIETITVLKDAAAIALYGSRASNGVILITTKKGKAGKVIYNFRHQTDISTRLNGNVEVLNQQQYLELLHETYKNTDPVYWTDERIKSDLISKFPYQVSSPGDTTFYPADNWIDALYNNASTTFINELSISGGNEKSNFYFNLEYTKQNGIEKTTSYDRKSIRFNYESRPSTWFKFGLNSTLSYNIQNYSSEGMSERAALTISPLNPIRQANGEFIYNYSWGFSSASNLATNNNFTANPLAASELNINRNISYRGLSRIYGELKFLKAFSFSSSIGLDFMLTEAKEKVHPLLASSDVDPGVGSILQSDIRNANLITNNILRFDRLLTKDHRINILLGQEAQIITSKNVYVTKQNLASNPLADQLTSGSLTDAGGLATKQTLLSYFGQGNYDFRNKYFLTGSIRADGSSLFGENKKFGSHWSLGAGWLVTSEGFMKAASPWLNYLKLRGSIGSAGNSAAIINSLRNDNLLLLSYLNTPAVIPNPNVSPGNPDIQWEKTFTWDAGLELRMFNEKIAITADIYERKTSEVIADINIASATGFSTLRDNIGDIKNQGIELSVFANIIRNKDFEWSITANWSKNQNKLLRSFFPIEVLGGTFLANGEGQNYNSFYISRWAGVDPATGKPQWIDSTGKPNSSYIAAKKEFVGKPQPDGFGAIINTISYKGIELSAMLYYQYGFQIYSTSDNNFLLNDGVNPYVNQSINALDRWQKAGDIAANPRRLLFGRFSNVSDDATQPSTRYLFDGDFIRLANVSLAFNFPENILNRFHLNTFKIFIQGHNLATWTKYTGQDPETANSTGISGPVYPIQRSFSLGLNVIF